MCGFCIVFGTLLAASVSLAQEGDPGDESAELAKKLQNPIASLVSVPFQNNFEWGAGRGDEGFKWTLNVQPVIPISLSPEWNLISRTIVPIIHQDDVVPDGSQTGMGDHHAESLLLSACRGSGWHHLGCGTGLSAADLDRGVPRCGEVRGRADGGRAAAAIGLHLRRARQSPLGWPRLRSSPHGRSR